MFVGAGIAGKMALGGQPLLLCLLVMIGVGLVGGAINALLVTHQKLVAFIATFATLYIGRGVGRWITQTRAMNLPDSFLTLGVSSDEREHPPRLPSGAALPNIRAMAKAAQP